MGAAAAPVSGGMTVPFSSTNDTSPHRPRANNVYTFLSKPRTMARIQKYPPAHILSFYPPRPPPLPPAVSADS